MFSYCVKKASEGFFEKEYLFPSAASKLNKIKSQFQIYSSAAENAVYKPNSGTYYCAEGQQICPASTLIFAASPRITWQTANESYQGLGGDQLSLC